MITVSYFGILNIFSTGNSSFSVTDRRQMVTTGKSDILTCTNFFNSSRISDCSFSVARSRPKITKQK